MSSRRQRFRAFIAAFNGAGAPEDALAANWYVEPMDPVARRVARRLELQPASAHLITGHVGTGKSTQLLVIARDIVEQVSEVRTIVVDLSEHQDLDDLQPGSLMALTGLLIGKQFDASLCSPDERARANQLIASFRSWANGYIDEAYGYPDHERPIDWVPGIVRPPRPDLAEDLAIRLDELIQLRQLAYGPETSVILLVDSLDRMSSLRGFETLITQDVKALLSAGLGVVLIGPLRATYGLERTVTDQVELYRQPAITLTEERGREFLRDIVRRRDEPTRLFRPAALERVVTYSGGVLRDLLKLAQKAGEEAYVAGCDDIDVDRVEVAADVFGRTLMVGLEASALAKLRDVAAGKSFFEATESDLSLLLTRRILEYQDSAGLPNHAIHPTLQRLLAPRESISEPVAP